MIIDQIKDLILQRVALVPVGEEGERFRVPFIKWSTIKECPSVDEVLEWTGKFDTNTFACILGEISNRLVCIDVDEKSYKGMADKVLREVRELYPNLYGRLRIERTRSGGIHIYYRAKGISELKFGNGVAFRALYHEEIEKFEAENKKLLAEGLREKKVPEFKSFIEVLGDGHLAHMAPSPGYSIISGSDIEVLSEIEHEGLVGLMKSYNEYSRPESKKEKSQKRDDWYSLNPFEDYNQKIGDGLLIDYGWREIRRTGEFVYYSKPGRDEKIYDAAFGFEKRLIRIFGNGGFEKQYYNPANLKCEVDFAGDKTRMYEWLVSEGYGVLKPEIEWREVKRAAENNAPLPANISEGGREKYDKIVEENKANYPHGIFWSIDEKGYFHIERERVYEVAIAIGYRLHNGEICKIEKGRFIEILKDEHDFYNHLKKYILEDEEYDLFNTYEEFLQKSGAFVIKRLDSIKPEEILFSGDTFSYKFYANRYIRITKEGIEKLEYSELDKLVWKRDILQRDFEEIPKKEVLKSLVVDFLFKAVGVVDDYLMQCLGYCWHDYRDERGYFIDTTEACERPDDGGGSGKNAFWTVVGQGTSCLVKAASQIQMNEKLLQSWKGQRIFCISDIPKGVKLDFLKELITGSATVKKLFKDEFEVPVEDMCKFVGSTNFSFDDSDPGIRRRIRAIEFSNYFTLKGDGALEKEYRKNFPKGWTKEDYSGFDNFMILCIRTFLSNNRVIDKKDLSESGWIKQFEEKYGHLYEFIDHNIQDWRDKKEVHCSRFIDDYYEPFCKMNSIKFKKTITVINAALHAYCKKHQIKFDADKLVKRSGLSFRMKIFGENILPDTEAPEEF